MVRFVCISNIQVQRTKSRNVIITLERHRSTRYMLLTRTALLKLNIPAMLRIITTCRAHHVNRDGNRIDTGEWPIIRFAPN